MKKEKGITLLSLVVTIIVMLILAGVSLHQALGNGNNGLVVDVSKQTKFQKDKSENITEQSNAVIHNQVGDWGY